jgi:hypothetical protein
MCRSSISTVAFLLFFLVSFLALGQGQKDTPPENAKAENLIGIGVGLPQNQSRRPVALSWEQTQLVRSLQELTGQNGSSRKFDVLQLKSASPKHAFKECPKRCNFVVVTTFVDTLRDSGVAATPDGIRVNPPPLGLPLSRCCASLEYKILVPGHPHPFARGLIEMPEGYTSEDAPQILIRLAADRIAKEVQKTTPPLGE